MIHAQDDDQPLVTDISYGMTVSESITDFAFFDWWQIDTNIGDKLVVSMQADDGLQPLVGLLDAAGDLVARSDVDGIAPPDGTAFLQYEVTTAGLYTIIATREGRDQGTTTGRYLLTVNNRIETGTTRPDPFMETEFRCGEWVLTNALTFKFDEDRFIEDSDNPPVQRFRVSVFGMDTFEPVIRLQSDVLMDRPLDCTDSSQATAGSQLILPMFEEPYRVDADGNPSVAMVTLSNTLEDDSLGEVAVTIGAKEGTSGRFIVVLEGLTIDPRDDTDELQIRRGALASDTTLETYIIGKANTRLDPVLEMLDTGTDIYQRCDDMGKDDCAELAPITEFQIIVGEDQTQYSGDRFDAGLLIDAEVNEPVIVTVSSRANSTAGGYLVVFVGELP